MPALATSRLLRVTILVTAFCAGCSESSRNDNDQAATEGDHDMNTTEGSHDSDAASEEGEGAATGSTCPEDNDLTYDSFGAQFMETYCTRCHSSELVGAARNSAPLDHDFDSLQGVLGVAEHIDQYAAAGPDAQNAAMPPDGDKPSLDERMQLGQWLACEVEALRGN